MAVNKHSFVVVGIPARTDRVWDISSEKVPHITLLYLGDTLENVDRVEQFISHAVDTSLSKFYLTVESRGTLGKDDADVLFFTDYRIKMLQDFRANLLTNPDILTAYNSTTQFPQWTPHLTLGYPESPAKPENRQYPDPGLLSVGFDRIALWTGDFEGVDFPLKTDELSMADRGEAAVLQHFGVKGMKWGVTHDQARAIGSMAKAQAKAHYLPSQDAKNAQKAQLKAKLGGTRAMTNQEMRAVINRMALEKQYRELYGEHQLHDEAVSKAKRWTKRGAKWVGGLLTDILRDGGSSWLKRPGSNASGRTTNRMGQQFGKVIEGQVVTRAIGR